MTVCTAKIKATGGWIDITYDGETITMAAVGPPLRFLVDEPKKLAQQQKRTTERGRYRRIALDALEAAGAPETIHDAELVWSHRAG